LLAACENEKPQQAERGYVIYSKQFKVYTPQEIQDLLNVHDFQPPFNLEHNVKAVKIAYMTPDPDGKLVNATGALYIPETSGKFPVISFQHGTQTQRYLVPSLGAGNSDAGLAGAVAASMGYVCMAADYLGLGESEIVPAYLLAENSANTVIDLLRAGYSYLESKAIETEDSLYLTGYSQGGYITMALHHEIERNYSDEFRVTASAPLAGPYDLLETVDSIIARGYYENPILMAYLVNSYNHYYGWDRMAEIFQEPYVSDIPGYFDGSQMMNSVNRNLPKNLDSLLQESFIIDYKAGNEQELRQALKENSLLDFIPEASVLLIHGDADRTVPYFNSTRAEKYYKDGGKTNVQLIMVEGNHETAAEDAIVSAMLWFEWRR
jgi:dienelactone hydrolase